MFANRVEELNIEHVTSIRDWNAELPNAVKLYGAYRRRKVDVDGSTIILHSFTFVRRESYLSCPEIRINPKILVMAVKPCWCSFNCSWRAQKC